MHKKIEIAIPSDLFLEIEAYAKAEELSINEFITWSLSEKVGELRQRREVKNLTFVKPTKPTLPVRQPDVVNTQQQVKEPNRLLKADEAAKILRLSKSGVYRLMQTGEIPVIRIHTAVRIREVDLEEFIKGQRTGE